MNSRQKIALGLGLVATVVLRLLYPWIGRVYFVPVPMNFEPFISWGISNASFEVDWYIFSILLVVVATGSAVLVLRSRKAVQADNPKKPPIPDP